MLLPTLVMLLNTARMKFVCVAELSMKLEILKWAVACMLRTVQRICKKCVFLSLIITNYMIVSIIQ